MPFNLITVLRARCIAAAGIRLPPLRSASCRMESGLPAMGRTTHNRSDWRAKRSPEHGPGRREPDHGPDDVLMMTRTLASGYFSITQE